MRNSVIKSHRKKGGAMMVHEISKVDIKRLDISQLRPRRNMTTYRTTLNSLISSNRTNIPKDISKKVSKLYRIFNKIAIYTDKKSDSRLQKDMENYLVLKDLLSMMEEEGRFEGEFSLNRKSWSSKQELKKWETENTKEWFNPETGEMTTRFSKDYIGAIPGDIISRGGVSGLGFLQHWGIYMGGGVILEIVRIGKTKKADIVLSSMEYFIQSPKYPAFIFSTISKNINGFKDNREYRRQESLWAASRTLNTQWIYGIGFDMNKYGVYDQTCQSYVNILLYGAVYTTQIWHFIYSTGMALGTYYLYRGKIINNKTLIKNPDVCIDPCKMTVIAGNGKKKGCRCISECNIYGSLKGTWCYVDEKCGRKKSLKKWRGKYYDRCDKKNKKNVCCTAKKHNYWKECKEK